MSGASAIATESFAAQGAQAAGAAVPPKLDLGTVGSPNWTNLLGEKAAGSEYVSRSSMMVAVKKANDEKLINFEQADYLKKAINGLPSEVRPTHAEASQLLTDIGLDVSRTVTISASSTGKAVVSTLDVGTDQKPHWANLIASEVLGTDNISRSTLKQVVASANEKGLIGPKQTAYIKEAVAELDSSSITAEEAVAVLDAIGLDIAKKVDVSAINAIPGSLAATDTGAGTAQNPDWVKLVDSATSPGLTKVGTSQLGKAIDAARSASVINSAQQDYLKDAVRSLPSSLNLNQAEGAKLLSDIGLDVNKPVTVTAGPAGAPVVSFLNAGTDQKPNWTNLITNEISSSGRVYRTDLTEAVQTAFESKLIGPKQTAYLKESVSKLDISSVTTVEKAVAQLEAIGLDVTKKVDIDAINKMAVKTP